jgi:hypothetical protein
MSPSPRATSSSPRAGQPVPARRGGVPPAPQPGVGAHLDSRRRAGRYGHRLPADEPDRRVGLLGPEVHLDHLATVPVSGVGDRHGDGVAGQERGRAVLPGRVAEAVAEPERRAGAWPRYPMKVLAARPGSPARPGVAPSATGNVATSRPFDVTRAAPPRRRAGAKSIWPRTGDSVRVRRSTQTIALPVVGLSTTIQLQ